MMATESAKRPDIIDWGIAGENAALRAINTGDPVDLERYWTTNRSVGQGLMVDDIETLDELVENAKFNGRSLGFTLAISRTAGPEIGEFQGFVQFSVDSRGELKDKIEQTGLFAFLKDSVLWEVSYARYPHSAPHQVASAVRQGCVLLLTKLKTRGFYPRLAVLGATDPDANPASLLVLQSACFDPIGTLAGEPKGIIKYEAAATALDSVWLLNWNKLAHKLRQKARPEWERQYRAV